LGLIPASARHRVGDPRWIPFGSVAHVAGLELTAGLFYVGFARVAEESLAAEPSLIDPELPVKPGLPAGPTASYRSFTPARRLRYLQWLASGRPEPVESCFIPLFVKGLERRVFATRERIEDTELRHIELELERLSRFTHGSNAAYLLGCLRTTVLCRRQPRHPLASYAPTFPHVDHIFVRTVLLDCAERGMPVPAPWALAAILARTAPLERLQHLIGLEETRSLFALSYEKQYGTGVAAVLQQEEESYFVRNESLPASRRFVQVRTCGSAEKSLPEYRAIETLAFETLRELGSYIHQTRGVVHREERIRRAGGLLPCSLVREYAGGLIDAIVDEVSGSPGGCLRVDAKRLARLWPTGHLPLSPQTLRPLAEALREKGFSFEPDPHLVKWSTAPSVTWIVRSEDEIEPDWRRAAVVAATARIKQSRTRATDAFSQLLEALNITPSVPKLWAFAHVALTQEIEILHPIPAVTAQRVREFLDTFFPKRSLEARIPAAQVRLPRPSGQNSPEQQDTGCAPSPRSKHDECVEMLLREIQLSEYEHAISHNAGAVTATAPPANDRKVQP
jgi:hypothetical protein